MTSKSSTQRYNLTLPNEVYEELKELADSKHTTVLELLRRFIKLGLFVSNLEGKPDATLLIREGDTEQRLLLL